MFEATSYTIVDNLISNFIKQESYFSWPERYPFLRVY